MLETSMDLSQRKEQRSNQSTTNKHLPSMAKCRRLREPCVLYLTPCKVLLPSSSLTASTAIIRAAWGTAKKLHQSRFLSWVHYILYIYFPTLSLYFVEYVVDFGVSISVLHWSHLSVCNPWRLHAKVLWDHKLISTTSKTTEIQFV